MERVVIMGGSSGMGEATAAAFVQRGAEVFVTGRDAAKAEASAARTGAKGHAVDGGDVAQVRRFFETVGPFSHLVLALTGGNGAGPLRELALDDVRGAFEAKFFAQLTTLQAALPYVRESVTFITAMSARAALPGTMGLAAVNGALEAAVGPLATELAPLRVNAVSPGIVDTPWWNGMPSEVKDSYFAAAREQLPARRVGRPEDIASAIVMLATNAFATGTILPIAGGGHLARS